MSQVDLRHFAALVPGARPELLDVVRREFAWWIAAQRRAFTSWQDAWNVFIGPSRIVTVTPPHCFDCNGRGWSVRSHARTGSLMCRRCGGSRRGRLTTLLAQPARKR